jgi:antitoxin VapB
VTKRFTEKDLLKGLDAHGAHADEAAEPTANELTPLERLRGSVLKYENPLADTWDEWFDAAGESNSQLSEDRDQPKHSAKREIELLAQRHDVVDLLTGSADMEEVLNRLTLEENGLDETEKLLVALEYAGVLSDEHVMALHAEYLAEKYTV